MSVSSFFLPGMQGNFDLRIGLNSTIFVRMQSLYRNNIAKKIQDLRCWTKAHVPDKKKIKLY